MQHFQSSAACVFLWQSVASSKFACLSAHVSERPSLYIPVLLYFASYFICGHHYLCPIFCMREIPLFQVCRNESFWKCTLPLKCQKLRPEYQLLLFDACCWTPTASSRPCCCRSSKVRRGAWGWRLSSEVFPLLHKSIITFVSFLFYANGL